MITVLLVIALVAVALDRPDVPKFIHRTRLALRGKNPDPPHEEDEE